MTISSLILFCLLQFNEPSLLFYNHDNSPWQLQPGGNNYISAIAVDEHGTAWLGGVDRLGRYDRGILTVFEGGDHFPRFMHVYSMVFDQNQHLYVGAAGVHLDDPGLIVYSDNSFQVFNESNSGILSNQILDIKIDSKNNVWLLHRSGISKYDGSWETFDTSSGVPTTSQSMAIDQNDHVWIGTQGLNNVLVRFDGTTWDTFNAPLNLFTMIADDSGNIWGGGEGMFLGRFSNGNWDVTDISGLLNGGTISDLLHRPDGILVSATDMLGMYADGVVDPITDVNDLILDDFHVSAYASNGDLFVGTQNGFAIYNPAGTQADPWVLPMLEEWPAEVSVLNFASVYNGLVTPLPAE